MTLIEKTLKHFTEKYKEAIVENPWSDKEEFNEIEDGYPLKVALILLEEALQEQDRESSREILKGIETYWNDNNYDEISSGGLIKHLGIDLKQDETKGSFAVWTPEIKEHANQVKEIIENREKFEENVVEVVEEYYKGELVKLTANDVEIINKRDEN